MTEELQKTVARSEIEQLRRWYARATDLIGTSSKDAISEGRAIYHRVFTPDAQLKTRNLDGTGYTAESPDEWVDVVIDALEEYSATQHLIGTQLVEFDRWETNAQGQLRAGSASMISYLQAWHSTAAGRLWLFLGTYEDKVIYTPDGWRIEDMVLVEVCAETRQIVSA